MTTRTRITAILLALVIVGGAAAAAVLTSSDGDTSPNTYRGSIPPARIKLPGFSLQAYAGATIRSDDYDGKVVLVTFLDTRCRSSCPLIAGQIGLAPDRLTKTELDEVAPLAITSDPPEDTLASIRAFLRRHGVEGRLQYLIGTVEELRSVWESFQVAASF